MRSDITTLWALCISSIAGFAVAFVVFTVLLHGTGANVSASEQSPALGMQDTTDPLGGSSVISLQNGASLIDSALGKPVPESVGPGLPVRLKIPVINVDSAIEYVGLAPDGVMQVPKNREDVAWLKLGQRPGGQGSAVIAGHFGIRDGIGSVFDNLHTLRTGDTLFIEDDLGASTSFVVREIRRYDPAADASRVFGSGDDASHLNLITCEGAWDDVQNGYPTRLIVFTDRIEGSLVRQ